MDEQTAVVLVTAPDRPTALQIARTLVESGNAACVNLLPAVESIYRWEGTVQTDQEILLLIKTRVSLIEDSLISLIREQHPYEVPEIIALPIIRGSEEYLKWILESTPGR